MNTGPIDDCQLNILVNGYPINSNTDSQCILDHAPQGTSRQEYINIRHSIVMSGVCPFEGQDGVSDEDNDKYIMDLAETFARLRATNRSSKLT
jgi:hypothetical protein